MRRITLCPRCKEREKIPGYPYCRECWNAKCLQYHAEHPEYRRQYLIRQKEQRRKARLAKLEGKRDVVWLNPSRKTRRSRAISNRKIAARLDENMQFGPMRNRILVPQFIPTPNPQRGHIKLAVEQVIEIKVALLRGDTKQSDLARQYGVSRELISQIAKGKVWNK